MNPERIAQLRQMAERGTICKGHITEMLDAIEKALAQPAQEPVAGTKTWFEDGKVVTQHLTAKDIYKDPEEQEPVAFAGIEIWVGNARIAKYLTQTELHYARDQWMLMQYSAEMCISKLKDKNNG